MIRQTGIELNGNPRAMHNSLIDLPIDPEEPNDWLTAFCKRNGLDESSHLEWPEDERVHVMGILGGASLAA